jgi:hypothetical protein
MMPPTPTRGRRAALEPALRRAVMARDAGLRRISSVTRWVLAGAVALSGGLALIAAKGFHGHTISNTQIHSNTSTPGSTQTQIPDQGQSGSGVPIQQPTQTPQPAQAPPVAVSGGS